MAKKKKSRNTHSLPGSKWESGQVRIVKRGRKRVIEFRRRKKA